VAAVRRLAAFADELDRFEERRPGRLIQFVNFQLILFFELLQERRHGIGQIGSIDRIDRVLRFAVFSIDM
jgi:hypothetical protein